MTGFVRMAVAASVSLLVATAALADADSYVPKLDTAEIPLDEAAARRLYETVYPKSWLEMLGPRTRILPQFAPPAEKGKRPAYLSMGDSISLCYLPHVRKALADRYAIHRIPHNGASTERGAASLDAYLEAGPFDLITVNWGLHDFASIRTPEGRVVSYRTDIEQYGNRLKTLVERLRSTGARVFWIQSLPILGGQRHRPEDVAKFNRRAGEIMAALDVPVIDLAGSPHLGQPLEYHPDGVHYAPRTCAALGHAVAQEIMIRDPRP